MREPVKDFYGKVLGWREDKGSKILATDFYGKQLGYYDKGRDCTCDFYGRVICSGDGTMGLITQGTNAAEEQGGTLTWLYLVKRRNVNRNIAVAAGESLSQQVQVLFYSKW